MKNLSQTLSKLDSSTILYQFAKENPSTEVFPIFPSTKSLKSGIYCIFTTHNSRVYIGSAKNFQYRFRKHRYGLTHNSHHCKHLQHVFNKYGKENIYSFLLEITDNLEKEELKWIKYFDAVKNGYNAVEDTQRNFYDSQLIKTNVERMSRSVLAFNLEGEYQMEFTSVSDAAKYFNDQSTNVSACCKGKLRYVKGHVFIYKSEFDPNKSYKIIPLDYSHLKEDRYKIATSLRMKGRVVTENEKLLSSVLQGKKLKCSTENLEFRSLKHAAKHYGISTSSISRSIEANRYCKGLKFEYL